MIHSTNLSNEHAKLYVVTCISNPCRYQTRYKLYKQFEKMVIDAGAVLYTVEMAFGNRKFEITESNRLDHVQVRSFDELWHKESLINIGISRLPADWEYVAWIDADILFNRTDWVDETMHQLQHYYFVQMFSHAQDLGPNYEPLKTYNGFIYSYLNNLPPGDSNSYYGKYCSWHPGYAWAARREAIDHVGGLIDWAILGAADRHQAFSLINQVDNSIPKDLLNTPYGKDILIWQDRANKYIEKDIGYVDGLINHYWHGKKKDRKYHERWQILTKNKFNPELDLKKDSQGLWQLTNRNTKLRDDLRAYFRTRNEDSIDL